MSEATNRMLERLIQAVTELRRRALALEQTHAQDLQKVEAEYQESARNLLHYLSLRQTDLRQLQHDLGTLGLSSLGRPEAYTLSSLDAVLAALHRLAGRSWTTPDKEKPPVNFRTGPMFLKDHTERLLGSNPGERTVRIMVTMPSEAATDPSLVHNLLDAGMDIMRINCAHDGPEAWLAMVENLRRAERDLGRSCKIYADLAGPKLRTGAIEPVGRVVHFGPRRDFKGAVLEPVKVWLTPEDTPDAPPDGIAVTLPASRDLVELAQAGDTLEIKDSRNSFRTMKIVGAVGASHIAESRRTFFIEEGAAVRLHRQDTQIAEGKIGSLPEVTLPLTLFQGETLVLTRETEMGRPAIRDEDGTIIEPARIPCTLEEAFEAAQPGESVWFDDGKIGGMITANDGERITVEIVRTGPRGAKLRSEKGINLPDTDLKMPALTAKDLSDLSFVAKLVDMVGLSFVRSPQDVEFLEEQLHELSAGHLGIVLKIENRQAFEQLPRLLLASLQSPPVGVMLARGDLASELGFARLAEVQEEILWLCEAAHVPLIWATQVLENLAKKGIPSRAEVSDAVMSGRAECVMLNKGPYIVEAVRFLSNVLERMQTHQTKSRAMLRQLSVSQKL